MQMNPEELIKFAEKALGTDIDNDERRVLNRILDEKILTKEHKKILNKIIKRLGEGIEPCESQQ